MLVKSTYMQRYYFILLIFFSVYYCISLQAAMTNEQLLSLGYTKSRNTIKGSLTFFHGWGFHSKGNFKVSNAIEGKVSTCFAGKHVDYDNNPEIKNPLSILDINKN